jgi:hypothetical protein
MLVRTDMKLAGCPGPCRARRHGRVGDALDQQDRAAKPGHRLLRLGEIGRAAVAEIDQRPAQAARRRRTREGMRDGGELPPVGAHPGRPREADIGVMAEQRRPIAETVELGLDIAHALQFGRRARQFHMPGERLAMRHQPTGIHSIDRWSDECF